MRRAPASRDYEALRRARLSRETITAATARMTMGAGIDDATTAAVTTRDEPVLRLVTSCDEAG